MRWLVEAADSKTGQETEITVEALTEADAERLARYNGLLVSRVSKAGPPPAPVVPYAGPLRRVAPRPRHLPHLARRARAAGRVGVALVVIGWIALVVAVIAFGDAAARHRDVLTSDWRAWLASSADAAWRPILLALAALAAGPALRLLAALALAVGAGKPAGDGPSVVSLDVPTAAVAETNVADAGADAPPDGGSRGVFSPTKL
jgi:hypothetical protein